MTSLLLLVCVVPGELRWYQSPYRLRDGVMGYRFGDPVTQVHEDTHGVNALLRNRYGRQCFYVGHVFVWFQPVRSFTLGDVAKRVRWRGAIFKTYLVDQRFPLTPQWRSINGRRVLLQGHDDNPLYVFDEWVAYANGALESQARRNIERSSDILFALEMGYYASVVVDMLPASYPDRQAVREFWLWHARRVVRIAEQAERTRQDYTPRQRAWRLWMVRRIAQES